MMWKMVCGAVLFASCFALHAASVPAFRWVNSFGGAGYDVIKAVAVDHHSGICIVGASSGDSTIAPRDNAARFDFSGELIWATQLGTSGARVVDLSVDGSGKFYALCAASGTNTIAGLRVENAARTTCGIIVTLDHHGKALNAVLLQGGEEFEPFALRVDAAGHCFGPATATGIPMPERARRSREPLLERPAPKAGTSGITPSKRPNVRTRRLA